MLGGRNGSRRGEATQIVLISAVWLGMVVLVKPGGEFPLNDDWVYARAVRSIVESGRFDLSQGPSTPNVFSQAVWGALFCLPYGFSFSALRFSTLVLGLAGVLGTYWLLREVGAGRGLGLLGSVVLAVNPIYFGLSNTFMTDVPFCAISTLSLLLLIRGLRRDTTGEVFVGIALSYVALLIRQIGIVIPMAFAVGFLCKKGVSKGRVLLACLPTLVGLLIQFVFQTWLEMTGRSSPVLGLQAGQVARAILSRNVLLIVDFPERIGIAMVYVGAFLVPLVIVLTGALAKGVSRRRKAAAVIAVGMFCLLAAGGLNYYRRRLPLVGNVLTECGLGPVKLRKPSGGCDGPGALHVLGIGWTVGTGLGVAGALVMFHCAVQRTWRIWRGIGEGKTLRSGWLGSLILSAIVIYMFPLGVNGYFDRYLLPLVPLWMAYLCWSLPESDLPGCRGRRAAAALAALVILGGFALGAAHDYLSWNRIRWRASVELVERDLVSPRYIDGGYEFNGWYLYHAGYKRREGVSMWVERDDYVISIGPLQGYEEVRRHRCERWLPFGVKEIYVLRKVGSSLGAGR